MQKAIIACGCFWGPEEKYRKINGISSTEVGYCGGDSSDVSYEEVCTGNTGHAEVVKLEFDENIITYENIISLFFKFHDATQEDGQGPNIGNNYRIKTFYLNSFFNKIRKIIAIYYTFLIDVTNI